MTISDRITVLAFGAGFLLPAIGALWKAASMRADTFEKWNHRVSLAYAGLSEHASRELIRIQELLVEFLPADGPFVPSRVVDDPSKLREPIARFERILSVRDRLRPRFRRLCMLGPILLGVIPSFMAGVVLVDLYHAHLFRSRTVLVAGVAVTAAAVTALLGVIVAYAYLQQRLSTAEFMSSDGAGS